jgi:hypothetical protein
MALPAQFVKAAFRYKSNVNARQECVMWYVPGTTIATTDGADEAYVFAIGLEAHLSSEIKDCLAADCSYVETVTQLSLSGVTFDGISFLGANDGAVGGDTQAENVAAVLSKRSSHGGKTGRGRFFMGCVPESFSDTSKLTSAALTAYAALAAKLSSNVITARATYVPQVYSRKDASMYPILDVTGHAYTKSQRRRLLRHT